MSRREQRKSANILGFLGKTKMTNYICTPDSFNDDSVEDTKVTVNIERLLEAVADTSSNERNDSETSISFDSTLTDPGTSCSSSVQTPSTRSSSPESSEAVLDFMDNLDDVDESYMLSVYWSAGDAGFSNSSGSVSGHTRCSYASSSTSATSLSNYTWNSSARRRHKGAYDARVKNLKKTERNASWVDTMQESTCKLLGPLNKWSISKGFNNEEAKEWDPKPKSPVWNEIDPIFDKRQSMRAEI